MDNFANKNKNHRLGIFEPQKTSKSEQLANL